MTLRPTGHRRASGATQQPRPVPTTVRQTGRRRRPTGSPGSSAPQPRVHRPNLADRHARSCSPGWSPALCSAPPGVPPTRSTPPCSAPSPGSAPAGSPASSPRSTSGSPGGRSPSSVSGCCSSWWCFKRWRHLFTFLGAVALVEFIGGEILYDGFTRPRPYDVTTIGRWAGFSLPSPPVAVVTMLLLGIIYGLVVPGPTSPDGAKWVAAGRHRRVRLRPLYLAVDHPIRHRARRRRVHGDRGQRLPLLHSQRGLPGDLPAGEDGPSRRERATWGGAQAGGAAPSSGSSSRTSSRWASQAPVVRPRCG